MSTALRQEMVQCLQSMGVWDRCGRRLSLESRAPAVVGRICDEEPLFETEASLGLTAPDRVIRGLAALAMVVEARRVVLAVCADNRELVRRLEQQTHGTRVELWSLPAAAPLGARDVLCDLAQLAGKSVAGAGLDRAMVADAVELEDIGGALQGCLPLWRTLSVVGAVGQPAIVRAPLGTSMEHLVQACGGAEVGWVAWRNGLPRGQRVGQQDVVELDTRGVLVLPPSHGQVREATTPLFDRIRRVAAACSGCRICTDACPVFLSGGDLEPHRVMQAVAAGFGGEGSAGATGEAPLNAQACDGCGVCSALCPARLWPSRIMTHLAQDSAEAPTATWTLRPNPDRMGRRLSVVRLGEVLGLASYRRPLGTVRLVPDRLVLPPVGPTGGGRLPMVRADERVAPGDVVALADGRSGEVDLRAPVAGRVVRTDPDDGVVIDVR